MAKLVVSGTNRSHLLEEEIVIIGRSSQCSIVVNDEKASRKHCKIARHHTIYSIQDLGSNNGTYINGQKIRFYILQTGDEIQIGKTTFVFESENTLETSLLEKAPILLIQFKDGKEYSLPLLEGTSYSLGRNEKNSVCLWDNQISSFHANIYWKENQWWIQDIQSKNGTLVNEKKITISPLKMGDEIKLGEICCYVKPPGYKSRPWLRPLFYAVSTCLVLLMLIIMGISLKKERKLPSPVTEPTLSHAEETTEQEEYLSNNDLHIFFAKNGTFRIHWGKTPLVQAERILREGDRGGKNLLIGKGQTTRNKNQMIWEGEFHLEEKGDPVCKARIQCQTMDNGIQMRTQISPLEGKPAMEIQWILKLATSSKNKLLSAESSVCGKDILRDYTKIVDGILWEDIGEEIGMFFVKPELCFMEAKKENLFLYYPQKEEWEWVVFLALQKKRKQWFALRSQINSHKEARKWGFLYKEYEKACLHFWFIPEVKTIPKEQEKLENLFEEEKKALLEEWERARFFRNLSSCQKILDRLKTFQHQWEGFTQAKNMETTFQGIVTQIFCLQQEEKERMSQQWLRQAKDLEADQNFALAFLFYEEILNHCPNIVAGEEARERVEELKKILPDLWK